MSRKRWNIASAKARLSSLVRRAEREPQVIERRGEVVAVVVGATEFERVSERERGREHVRKLLRLSGEIRAAGGASLRIPRRVARPDPIATRRR